MKIQKISNRIHITCFHEGENTLGRNIRGLHGASELEDPKPWTNMGAGPCIKRLHWNQVKSGTNAAGPGSD